uniref:Death domain-containing protein n=1 Tax=Amphimedon queenslandica TaxID=400682 RepID=A0A1X7T9H2_AMPQE
MATNQTCLGVDDLIDVLDLLKRCGFPKANWYDLGLRLGLKKSTLDVIEKNYPHDLSRCMTECLSQWLGRADNVDSRGGANLNSLLDALRSMNETAVAEKLKHQVLINIFNNRHTVLSQSLCDPFAISQLLYGERMLTQEAVSRVVSASPSIPNQREALLTGVKEAVQTDPNSLHTFANVLCIINTNVSLGQTILDDISKYFPTPEVGVVPETIKDPQDNTSTANETSTTQSDTCSPSNGVVTSNSSSQPLSPQAEVQVPVSKDLQRNFTSMRMFYGRMFYNVGRIIKQKHCSLKNIKELLSCCSPVLSEKVKKCRNISSILCLIQNECSLTNIEVLHCVVEEINITETDEHIKAYKAELKEFCKSLSISLCLNERFAFIPPLQCQTVTFVLDWVPEEHVLKDIEDLLAKASGKLLKIEYIKRTNSICISCSFPFSDVGFTVLRMIENIHILMGQGLKKLTIGNLTLWRRQDFRLKELKGMDQDLLQHTEVISYIILEETEYKLRDTISSKEKKLVKKMKRLRNTIREVSVVDMSTGDVGPAKIVGGELGWTVEELKQHIGELFNIKSSCMRIVMEEGYRRRYDTSVRDISNVGGTLRDILIIRQYKQWLYVSSDPKDYQKEYEYSLMYKYVDFHVNSILLKITLPLAPGPEATPTTTNVTKRGTIIKFVSINKENKEKERKIQVQVDKRITLAQLKEELVPLIGVPPTGFIVYEIIGNEEYEMQGLYETLKYIGSELIVRLGRALGRGEKRIKLYLLQVNNTEFCNFMMWSIVAEGTPVSEFKKQIIEEAKVQGIDCVLELDKMRLRYKNRASPVTVYVDHELIDVYSREMYVEPLKGPEKKRHYDQKQVYVIRWRPSQCSVDPIEEIIPDNDDSKHAIGKLSELSGVPAEYIYCTKSQSFPVEISCLDIENKLDWYSISSDRDSLGLYYYDDGHVIYYKDKRERMKELTDKERSEIQEAEEARLKRIREYNIQHGHRYWK